MYIEVILPLKISWAPTYKADALNVLRGQRVRVHFARREYVGVVRRLDVVPDVDPSKIQEIDGLEDRLPAITEQELQFWEFLSEYYLCTIGEVYKAAYPAMKLKSEKVAASVSEREENGRQKRLEAMQARVDRLEIRLKAKEAAIESKKEGTKARAELEAGKEKILLELAAARQSVSAMATGKTEPEPQTFAKKAEAGKPTLLHGRVQDRIQEYSRLLDKVVGDGGQALVLCPEKAFCLSLAERIGHEALIFNSDCSPVVRRKMADAVRSGNPAIVLGTRSALFLPFCNLHLIIIDEEQEQSYKQTEPAPRYNGRDAAIALGRIHGAQVVLGAAAPSLETLLNTLSNKYISKASYTAGPSATEIIDIPAEKRKNGMVGALSRKLIQAVSECGGPAVLIRGWENQTEIQAQCNSLFGEGRTKVMSLAELKRNAPADIALLALLQADAFLGKDDFRSDEKAMQMLAVLQYFCPQVLIQTAVAERFSGARTTEDLLKERKDFNLPPYARTVDVLIQDNSPQRGQRMAKLLAGAVPGALVLPDRVRWNFTRGKQLSENKKAVLAAVERLEEAYRYTGHFIIDVDPQ